jgi:hypothetical protein
MKLEQDWESIRRHFNRSFSSSLHTSIGSVNQLGEPTVTPIGSLFLNADRSGFYFEKYPTKLNIHASQNGQICVLAVDSNKWFWFKALWSGKFKHYPGIKLYGKLGLRRKASDIEISRLRRRMKLTRGLKGNSYLWGDMQEVREIKFTRAEAIKLGKMTHHL